MITIVKRRFKKNPKDFIQRQQVKSPDKPGSSPSAQSNRLLHPDMEVIRDLNSLYNGFDQNVFVGKTELAVIELLMFYGLRISEVLRIGFTDVLPNGYIRIRGSKNSNDRMIYPSKNSAYWQNILKYNLPINRDYSRFYFYRLFKRLGIYERFQGRKNTSVTHYFRQQLMRDFQTGKIDINLRQQFIGHKSPKSTKHYESN